MSNKDVFAYTRNPKPAGVLSTEDSILVLGGANAANRAYLTQGWSIDYSQQVEELYEIGSNRMYWKKGRPMGQGSIGRIVGAGTGTAVSGGGGGEGMFPSDAFDVCNGGASMALKVRGGSCANTPGSDITFQLAGVVVAKLDYSSDVADAQVKEGISWRFSHLQIN